MMDKIAIFCSASENIEPVFFEKARELGVWMGQNKKTLVYGGANIGLMECIAKAAKDNGSMIMGVIPTKLEERGRASDLVDVTFRTDNLSDRKDVMLNESDVRVPACAWWPRARSFGTTCSPVPTSRRPAARCCRPSR